MEVGNDVGVTDPGVAHRELLVNKRVKEEHVAREGRRDKSEERNCGQDREGSVVPNDGGRAGGECHDRNKWERKCQKDRKKPWQEM